MLKWGDITNYNRIRKEYVTRKISKEEILEESNEIQHDLNNFSM
jgi:hypothetical protein